MGTVYAGTNEDLQRQDAIKLLQMDFILERARRANPHLLTDPQALEQLRRQTIKRFQLEARAAGRLTHPNIVRIYDHVLLSADQGYISMELVEGQTLQKYIVNQTALPYPLAVAIARQVASGISAAHRSKVIHRDLKPANIMLVFDEGELQVKVLDFGLAKLKEQLITGGGLTSAGTVLGTPYYMSPEQCKGEMDLDERSDIYSFGVILFEILSGRRPFEGASATAIAVKHISEMPPEIRNFRSDIPDTLENLVMQSLRKSPSERPQSMAEISRTLQEIEHQFLVSSSFKPDYTKIPSQQKTLSVDAETLVDITAKVLAEGESIPTRPIVRIPPPHRTVLSKVRLYDLAKELKIDTKRLIEEVRREGVLVSVPSQAITKELAEEIRDKYFPKKENPIRRAIKVVKKAARPALIEERNTEPLPEPPLDRSDFGDLLDQFAREQAALQEGGAALGSTIIPLQEPPPGGSDFGALLDQFEREQSALQKGELARGTVVGIIERGVLIDFGYKSEGIVDKNEFMVNGRMTVNPGDEVDVVVKNIEAGTGLALLSRIEALSLRAWEYIERAFAEGTTVTGRVKERTKGGLLVDVNGIEAFMPGSQVDIHPVRNLDSLRGQQIEAKVIKLNRKRSNVVISRKAAIEERNADMKGHTLGQIEEGIIVEGQIKNLTDYGAFVDLGGVDGLLHVIDMSWGRLQNPAELFRVGDTVQVKVLKFDRERGRVSLGYKQLLPDPWETLEERFPPGARLTGTVAGVADYGAFVELEPGVEGLVHISEMSWDGRIQRPNEIVRVGDNIPVQVLDVDFKSRRIRLSMKLNPRAPL